MFSEWISSQLVLCHEHHSSYNCWFPLGIFRLQKCCYRSSIHPEKVKKKVWYTKPWQTLMKIHVPLISALLSLCFLVSPCHCEIYGSQLWNSFGRRCRIILRAHIVHFLHCLKCVTQTKGRPGNSTWVFDGPLWILWHMTRCAALN